MTTDSDRLLDFATDLHRALYPEARIPETPMPRKYSYDDECEVLARHFLIDGPYYHSDIPELSQHIQGAIEDWLRANVDARSAP